MAKLKEEKNATVIMFARQYQVKSPGVSCWPSLYQDGGKSQVLIHR